MSNSSLLHKKHILAGLNYADKYSIQDLMKLMTLGLTELEELIIDLDLDNPVHKDFIKINLQRFKMLFEKMEKMELNQKNSHIKNRRSRVRTTVVTS